MHSHLHSAVFVALVALPLVTAAQSFVLSTEQAGLSAASNSNGVAVADYDLDGDLDIYFVNSRLHDESDPGSWSRLYTNNGDGTFSDVTDEAGVRADSIDGYNERNPLHQQHGDPPMGDRFGAAWGDYDNDGDPDLFLTAAGREILYHNNGDGTFTDATSAAGLESPRNDIAENSSAAWWDYDSDGDLDLYVGSWYAPISGRMYENQGDGTFLDVTEASGLKDIGQTWTPLPIDVNSDGWIDLYAVNDFGPNRIFINDGNKNFVDETDQRALGDDGHGMGVTLGDYDNDGDFDIYHTNIYQGDAEWNPLFENDGTGHFSDVSHELGVEHADWAWGTAFFDCDHDGDLDLYVANGFRSEPPFNNRLFVNSLVETGEVAFENVAPNAGVDGLAEARSLAVFDYDNDGDVDLLVANIQAGGDPEQRNMPYLYQNVSSTANWLKVELEGTTSNRNGFGARVSATTATGTYHRHHDGISFLGQSIAPLHFGLGEAEVVESLAVTWLSGLVETYPSVEVNRTKSCVKEAVSPCTPRTRRFRTTLDLSRWRPHLHSIRPAV
jgi:hypothetical protein